MLREDQARLKALLAESRGEVERERRIRSEAELEKEHFRSQMHRLALALKREREKSATIARQELEQLRLEFLAREERYILDGDRDELRTIRYELAALRAKNNIVGGSAGVDTHRSESIGVRSDRTKSGVASLQEELSVLLTSGYDAEDDVVRELKAAISMKQEEQ